MNVNLEINKENQVIDYKSYKWLISSSLQKSLRRGDYELANSYVEFLWEHDRNYLTYRLGTILTEDVGFVNLDILEKYLGTELKKLNIDEMGGLDFIKEVVKESCLSIKDRSSCDAAYFASYFDLSHNIKTNLNTMISKEDKIRFLKDIINNPEINYVDRINAAWITLGNNKFKNANLSFFEEYLVDAKDKSIDNVEDFLNNFNLSERFLSIMKNAYLTQREQIVLGLPIVQYLYNEDLERRKLSADINSNKILEIGSVIEKKYFQEESYYQSTIGLNIINSAIDGHTREGKGAYYRFLKQKNAFTEYMNEKKVRDDLRMIILSHCMFRVEGHEVNKRVYFPHAVKMMNDCTQKILNMKIGLEPYLSPEEHSIPSFTEIRKILLEEMPTINNLREKQIQQMEVPYVVVKERGKKSTKLK